MKPRRQKFAIVGKGFHFLRVVASASILAIAFFLVLPLIQTISKPPATDTIVQEFDTGEIEPPTPTPEEESEEEPETEEEPPQLSEESQRLDLSQIELALNQGAGDGVGTIASAVKLKLTNAVTGGGGDALYALSDLDQRPRIVYQPSPRINSKVRRQTRDGKGKVFVIFVVGKQGKVENATVQSSSHNVFERPALAAVRKWRFEPGKRGGQAVRFRMRVPIVFPEGL